MTRGRVAALVGGGMAAVHAAEALRREGFDGRVLLFSAEQHLPYDRPPLSKALLRGELTPVDCLLRPPEWYAEQGIDVRLGVRVDALDPDRRTLRLDTGEHVGFDRALLATGAHPRWPAGLGPAGGPVFALRTVDDCLAIRSRLRPGASVAVVGGGFVGAELASSAASLGCRVTMLEATEAPFQRVLGRTVGELFGAFYAGRGIRLVTGAPVTGASVGSGGARLTADGGRFTDADVVVVGVGAVPDTELAVGAGLRVSDGVEVDAYCTTSVPHVFAAGDVANRPEPVLGGRVRIEHWQNAQHQGTAAGRAMLGIRESFDGVPWFWSDQFGLNLQVAGFPERADRVVVRGGLEGGRFGAFYLSGPTLVAMLGVGCAGEVHLSRRLIAARVHVDPQRLTDEHSGLRDAVLASDVPTA
ncbi:FAD-dependent oxidoreductase [Pseudonocardia sp.]|uniref:NAD(P)/FAD-dependent oxidoreductase n=1 Tax=Pseudonocardia sp. TaxID=60912 RepID=UPI002635E23D|nr:FAD-dependent oxidoreductase [Pseudonocardia sp.]